MASNNKSFFESFSGKIGNVVVYAMNGKTVIRTLPAKRKRNPTEKQVEARNTFSYILKIMQKIKPVVKIGFAHVAHNRTAFQEAMSVNLNTYKNTDNKDNGYTWLHLSAGNRAGFSNLSVAPVNEGIEITWSYGNPEEHPIKDDNVIAVAIEHQENNFYFSIAETKRSQGTCIIRIPKSDTTRTFSIFLFAIAPLPEIRQNPNLVSNSQWVGSITT